MKENKLQKCKRILALTGAILLVLLYVATFILAFGKSEGMQQWFTMCFGGTFLIPLVLYGMWLIYKALHNHREDASASLQQRMDEKPADAQENGEK